MSNFKLSKLLPKLFRSEKSESSLSETDPGLVTKGKGVDIKILFLDDTDLSMTVKGSWKALIILERVFKHLNIIEKEYFGLRYIDNSGQNHWLSSGKTISSQLKGCSPPFTFYFGVKFYAADPCKLREEVTRYQVFLQVKRDVLQGRLPVSYEDALELCAYVVQSELGDYDPRRHVPGYVSELELVPNQTNELEERVSSLHQRLVGHVPTAAEYKYLDKVKWLDMYGVDLHPVLGDGSIEYFLGLTPTGIVVYKNKTRVGNYFWPRINKVRFKRKLFVVKVKDRNNDEHSYAFELRNKDACKHLWKCCVEHHAFFRLNRTERNSSAGRLLSMGSRYRYSGRTERQVLKDIHNRSQPDVLRVPSRRQQRRTNSDTRLNARSDTEGTYNDGQVTVLVPPEPVKGPRHRSLPDLQKDSPTSTRSAPWESNYEGGLYTSGRESPESMRSEKMKFPTYRGRGAQSGSDSESGMKRKYFPRRRGSDNESDVSVPRRRRREADSGSESDISLCRSHHRRRHRPKSTGEDSQNWKDGNMPGIGKENYQNGSIPSMHPAPGASHVQRRRRRRSKSPGKRPPEELLQHFEYGLVDTDGMTEDQLRDIAFVQVETNAEAFKIPNKARQKQKYRPPKNKSFGGSDKPRKGPGSDISVKSSQSHRNSRDPGAIGVIQSQTSNYYHSDTENAPSRQPNQSLEYSKYSPSTRHSLPREIQSSQTSQNKYLQENPSFITRHDYTKGSPRMDHNGTSSHTSYSNYNSQTGNPAFQSTNDPSKNSPLSYSRNGHNHFNNNSSKYENKNIVEKDGRKEEINLNNSRDSDRLVSHNTGQPDGNKRPDSLVQRTNENKGYPQISQDHSSKSYQRYASQPYYHYPSHPQHDQHRQNSHSYYHDRNPQQINHASNRNVSSFHQSADVSISKSEKHHNSNVSQIPRSPNRASFRNSDLNNSQSQRENHNISYSRNNDLHVSNYSRTTGQHNLSRMSDLQNTSYSQKEDSHNISIQSNKQPMHIKGAFQMNQIQGKPDSSFHHQNLTSEVLNKTNSPVTRKSDLYQTQRDYKRNELSTEL